MIFLGDLACPANRIKDFNASVEKLGILSNEVVVINLEAVIKENGSVKEEKLYNHPAVLDIIRNTAKKVIVSLANNHMYDYPEEIIATKTYLESLGIGVFGLQEADGGILPYEYEDETGAYTYFGHCWNLYTYTNPNNLNHIKIADLDYAKFREVISSYITKHPFRKVICFMHWNYDLEKYPFPMHRKFAHDLIDLGCEAVIGSHSHIAQPIEIYRNKIIAYCLGNFYLPSGIFFNGKLKYPEQSHWSIGVKISNKSEILRFETDTDRPVKYINSVSFDDYENITDVPRKKYITDFKDRRAKSFLVPIFTDYTGVCYRFKNKFAIYRILTIKFLKKHILK